MPVEGLANPHVEVQIITLRPGHHAVAQDVRLILLRHLDRVLLGGNGDFDLMTGLFKHRRKLHNALRLVVDLPFHK